MNRATRVKVIGRSLQDVTIAWGKLQPFFGGADLIVSDEPVDRALEGRSALNSFVFAVLDSAADMEELKLLDGATDWLFVLCPASLMQTSLAEIAPMGVTVLPLEHAELALKSIESRTPNDVPSARKLS